CGLYLWKGLYPTALLFAIYTVISLFGYFKWAKMAREN
ncbi:MAG TPA: nicotinamide mononucleotide transporter, partial [Proteiniphilum sp.]|nr:nicotinamide mononucleotide transporter [Proteiniphilum sp.]